MKGQSLRNSTFERFQGSDFWVKTALRAVITGVLRGCFLEIGVCFLHNATQREIKEATKSHRRKTTAARFCVSRKNGGLLAEKQAPPKNGGVLVFPVRTALRPGKDLCGPGRFPKGSSRCRIPGLTPQGQR